MLLYSVAIISVKGCSHIGALDEVSLGNAYANAAAKQAALVDSPATF